ncbi:hypothetical protein JCM19232_149 [Vibrio ishigakensis]|uniref:SnoaL-like domain-containing protein n=1 Tax=Vibrio ishigakensis TaxID=1481914 RepID=A0A0B8P0S6_9VIBR|nr:hypothetical protein JCM19232_149 [Vibrio ishigakensis]
MKAFKGLLFIMLGLVSASISAQTLDEAKVRSAINGFSTFADQGAYEYLGRVFAPELTVDYTSLFDGEVTKVKREDLLKQWAGFLPGFDATFHDLSNVQVTVSGDKATATADITASHYLGEGFWAVSGSYDFALVKSDENWQISAIKINATSEEGSRDILAEAPKFAEANLEQRQARLVKD